MCCHVIPASELRNTPTPLMIQIAASRASLTSSTGMQLGGRESSIQVTPESPDKNACSELLAMIVSPDTSALVRSLEFRIAPRAHTFPASNVQKSPSADAAIHCSNCPLEITRT